MPHRALSVRSAGPEDCDRLAVVGAATFLETFAGEISGDALLTHCRTQHSAASYETLLAAGAKAWLAESDGAPVGYALLAEPDLDAADVLAVVRLFQWLLPGLITNVAVFRAQLA